VSASRPWKPVEAGTYLGAICTVTACGCTVKGFPLASPCDGARSTISSQTHDTGTKTQTAANRLRLTRLSLLIDVGLLHGRLHDGLHLHHLRLRRMLLHHHHRLRLHHHHRRLLLLHHVHRLPQHNKPREYKRDASKSRRSGENLQRVSVRIA
jgi:hypothetical protein